MYIQDSELQRIFNMKNWRISLNYAERDLINEIQIRYDKVQHSYIVKANVDVYNNENEVFIILNELGEILEFSCDCRYCLDNLTACGHIGVVLLKLNDLEPTSFPYYYRPVEERQDAFRRWMQLQMVNKSKALIERFAKQNESEFHANLLVDKIKLFAYTVIKHGTITVNYKLGLEKIYVIKNIITFLTAIEQKQEISYGKSLTFYHHIHSFDETAKLQIYFLQQYLKEHMSQYSFGYSSNYRALSIDTMSIDAFYDTYSEEANDYINMCFGKEELQQLPLHIQQNDEFYIIQCAYSKEELIKGQMHWYYLHDNILYRFHSDVKTHCNDLLEELQKENQLCIHKDDMIDFCKYVIPMIKEYTNIEGISLHTFMPYPVFIQSYIDVEENGDISIKITYHMEDSPIKYGIDEHIDNSLELDHVMMFIKEYATVLDYDAHVAYIQEDDVHLGAFLKDGLDYLNELCEVFVSDAIKQMNAPKKIHMQVGVQMKNNLLEIDINSVDVPRDELYRVLASYRKRKKYHRLRNGDLLYLQGEELEEVDNFLQDLHIAPSQFEKGNASIANYHSFELENFANDAKYTEVKRNKQFQDMMKKIATITPHTYDIPESYHSILRDYQKFGYQWLKTMSMYGFGGILADDMGLGKTLQIIAFLENERKEHAVSIALVICPASLILNWKDEIHKFSKTLSCLCVHGVSTNRLLQIKQAMQYDIIITSYDYIRRDYEAYQEFIFPYIILDEAQYIKNHTTKNAFAVKQIKGIHRFALTGTPIENSLAELWSIFDFLMPAYLYNYHYFRSNFEREIIKNKNEKVQAKLKKMVEPFILRRIKKEVLTELPEKMESVYYQEFDEEEKKIYIANLTQINSELQQKMQVEEVDKFMILAMMTRLRQICCDARLLYENVQVISSKLQGCLDIILAAKTSGKKVLLFSSFTSMLDLIEAELLKENIRYVKLTGETRKEKRHEYVEQFQNGPYDVFLISLKAGGTGLNLTAAEIVIHFDPWWNMSAQNQATDRAYRIGQTKSVQVYKLIMKDSIEEKILKLQQRKMNLSDTFVSGNEGSITSMSNEEIMALFE